MFQEKKRKNVKKRKQTLLKLKMLNSKRRKKELLLSVLMVVLPQQRLLTIVPRVLPERHTTYYNVILILRYMLVVTMLSLKGLTIFLKCQRTLSWLIVRILRIQVFLPQWRKPTLRTRRMKQMNKWLD